MQIFCNEKVFLNDFLFVKKIATKSFVQDVNIEELNSVLFVEEDLLNLIWKEVEVLCIFNRTFSWVFYL